MPNKEMCVDGRLHSFHRIPSIHSHCLGMPLDKFDCHLGMVFVLPHQQIRIKLKILSTHTDIFGWDEIVMYFHTQSFHTFFVLFFFSFFLSICDAIIEQIMRLLRKN